MSREVKVKMILGLIILIGAFLISLGISVWVRKTSSQWGLIDVPNQRSSHEQPTPKGGGIGIAVAMTAALTAARFGGIAISRVVWVILTGALVMAFLGYLSDRRPISPYVRMAVQALIAFGTVFLIGSPEYLHAGSRLHIGVLGTAFAVFWLVAVTNFYNFMDGIDGLAAMQAVTAGLGLAGLGVLLDKTMLIPAGLVAAAAASGFLVLNVSKNKIFMGDVGSYLLGFYFSAFALIDERLLVPVSLMLGVFVADTVTTLFIRISRREPWHQAHRSHFYQRAVKLGYSHLQVTSFLSVAFLALAVLACVYLQVNMAALQLGIIGGAGLMMLALAGWVVWKERQPRERETTKGPFTQ